MSIGRLYTSALLVPLAEQLVDAARIASGMRVVDVFAADGHLTRRLAAAVGASGSVTAVAIHADEAQALGRELRGSSTTADVVVASPVDLPYRSGEFDSSLSLLQITAETGGSDALGELQRVAVHATALVTGAGDTTPLGLLARAFDDVTGAVPAQVRAPEPASIPPGWTSTRVGDVTGFDSEEQLWLAAARAHVLDDASASAVRARLRELLVPYERADGTLRIPVTVTLLRGPAG